jgi:nucleoside-diphosphate-sugar epimerase
MSRALLLGGTGVVGRAIATRLLESGWRVDITGRDPRKFTNEITDRGGQYVISDRHDVRQLRDVFASGADLLVDCACYTEKDAEQLVPFARDATSTVMISSKAVYVDANGNHPNSDESPNFGGPIHESQPTVTPGNGDYSSREGYGANKIAAEHVLLNSGASITVVRPSKVHGVGAVRPREWYFVKRALDRRPRVLLQNGGQSVDHPTAAENLAALVEVVAKKPARRVLNSADPDAPNVQGISRAIAAALSFRWNEVFLDGDETESLGASPWDCHYPIILDTSASLELGYVPVGTYEETVRATVLWLRSIAIFGELVGLPDWLDNEFFKSSFDYRLEDRFLSGEKELGV